MKIAICIPHNYLVYNKLFINSLLGLVNSFHIWNGKNGMKHEIDILIQNEGFIDLMRNILAQRFMDSDSTYSLWLDTDMVFPPDMIIKMIKQFEEDPTIEAITGLYHHKTPPFMPHVYYRYDTELKKFTVAGSFPLKKSFTVAGAGFGCIMINKKVFDRTEKPWFKMGISDDYKMEYGEDLYFCKKAKMKMICDPTLMCGHLSETVANTNHYIAVNQLKVENDDIVATKEQLEEIHKKHDKN